MNQIDVVEGSMTIITYEEFARVDLRSGTIVKVETFSRAQKPAYKIWVDFGIHLGILQTSAQVTLNYTQNELLGRSVIGCVNLGKKDIAGFISEFLLVGFSDKNNAIRIATVDSKVPNGSKLH